jgi:uncharacterized alkaline shock family protein YloU
VIDPEAVRDATLAIPAVLGMHPGPHGTAATFSAHGRIWGVRLDEARIDVHIVAAVGHQLAEVGRSVREAVYRAVPDYAGDVVVHIEDITAPQPTAHPHEVASGATVVERTDEPRRIP